MAKNPTTKASTTSKTKQISIRIPNDIFSRLAAASGIGGDRTGWIIEAIVDKLDRQVQGIKQGAPVNVPVCNSKPPMVNEVKTVLPEFKNVSSEVVGIISDMRAIRTPHNEIADYLNAEGYTTTTGDKFTKNSSCVKNYDKKYKELNK